MVQRVAVFVTLALCWGGAANAQQTSGKLVAASGEVWVQPPGEAEATASEGQAILPGSRIRTGRNGSAEIRFDDGSILRLRGGSKMQLSAHRRQKKKNSVVLFFGRLWSKVRSAAGASDTNYEVKTANAVCGVRGTEFETAVGDDGSVRVRVADGEVAVGDGAKEEGVNAGQEVEANEDGVDDAGKAAPQAGWKKWGKAKRERLRKGGKAIVDKIKARIMDRKERVEALRAEQDEIKKRQAAAKKSGDAAALQKANDELAAVADAIADLGDEAEGQFGVVDHFADLASDPRFRMVDRKYLKAEAASLRRIKKMFDSLVAEGTDISIEAMDKMIDEMSEGKGSLKEGPGSTMDDLFGPGGGDMDMR